MTHIHNSAGKLDRLYKRQGGRCAICGEPMSRREDDPHRATLDHVMPRSLGGGGSIRNLRAAGMSCNTSRGRGEEKEIFVEINGIRAMRHELKGW